MKPKSAACTAELISYGGWQHCIRLSDKRTELVATTDVGPRVIRFGFIGGPNLLKEYPEQLGQRGERNGASTAGTACGPPRKSAGARIRRTTIRSSGDGLGMCCACAPRPIRSSAWPRNFASRSRMRPGGEAIFPQEPYATHPNALLPVRPLVLWAYTNMNDPRWTWGENEIRLRQDPKAKDAQKVGFFSTRGWMAYRLNSQVFIKRHTCASGATYPDMGCNVEPFTNQDMLELETLGPLVKGHTANTAKRGDSSTWGGATAFGR